MGQLVRVCGCIFGIRKIYKNVGMIDMYLEYWNMAIMMVSVLNYCFIINKSGFCAFIICYSPSINVRLLTYTYQLDPRVRSFFMFVGQTLVQLFVLRIIYLLIAIHYTFMQTSNCSSNRYFIP